MSKIELIMGNCLEKMTDIPDGSMDAIICDLPFYKVIKEGWDNKWKTEEDYIAWCEEIIIQYKRLLKENGNIYVLVMNNNAKAQIQTKYLKK